MKIFIVEPPTGQGTRYWGHGAATSSACALRQPCVRALQNTARHLAAQNLGLDATILVWPSSLCNTTIQALSLGYNLPLGSITEIRKLKDDLLDADFDTLLANYLNGMVILVCEYRAIATLLRDFLAKHAPSLSLPTETLKPGHGIYLNFLINQSTLVSEPADLLAYV